MKTSSRIVPLLIGLALIQADTLPASAARLDAANAANGNGNAGITNNADTEKINGALTKAQNEITRRIEALEGLAQRIQKMKLISDEKRSEMTSDIRSRIADLEGLSEKLTADDTLATLREDVRSVTDSYHGFALAIPRGAITAAADRALVLAGTMDTLGDKLETRILDAKQAGKNVAAIETSLIDYRSKIEDAKIQAQAAIDAINGLSLDTDDKAGLQAGLAVMKDARLKIRAAQQDFVAARKDAKNILQELRAPAVDEEETATEETD